jgi:hypothetical protein
MLFGHAPEPFFRPFPDVIGQVLLVDRFEEKRGKEKTTAAQKLRGKLRRLFF